MTGTYKLHNFVTGHYYIGTSLDVFGRYTQHLKEIAARDKPKKWQRAWDKHPDMLDVSNWECLVLQEFETTEEAGQLESALLQEHVGRPLCLNSLRTSATNGSLTQAARDKLAAANRGQKRSDEARAKMSAVGTGRTFSAEHKDNIRQSALEREARRRAEKAGDR